MPYAGSHVKSDIKELWVAGETNLPQMAVTFGSVNQRLHETHVSELEPTKFFPKWCELRDELQEIFKKSADNLKDTGEALRKAAEEYADTDSDGAAALRAAKKTYGDDPPMPTTYDPDDPQTHRP
ncbi:MAG: hypothetical protein ACRD0P_02825 [Stackebrandtia sp.]